MTHLSPGFADPVLDAQASFRAILEAMSRPGRIQRIDARITPPAPLCTAAAAALLDVSFLKRLRGASVPLVGHEVATVVQVQHDA